MTTKQRYGEVYYNARWRKASAAFLSRYPFCVLCLCMGEVNRGCLDFHSNYARNLVVDHIVPHRGDRDLFWDQDNWQTLCRMPCHDVHKKRCEDRQQDWYALLRQEIAEYDARLHVQRHTKWIPPAVANSIYVV